MDALAKKVRKDSGLRTAPTCGLIDSQRTKTTFAFDERRFDVEKKSRGVSGTLSLT